MKHWMATAAVLLLISLSTAAQETQVVEEVLVKINDEIITLSDFEDRFEPYVTELSRNFSGNELDERIAEARKEIFNILINRKLLKLRTEQLNVRMTEDYYNARIEEFKKNTNSSTDAEFQRALQESGVTMAQLRDIIEMQFTIQYLFQKEISSNLITSESTIQEFYEEHLDRYTVPAKLRLSQIVFPYTEGGGDSERQEAESALQRIHNGEDFGKVYREVTPLAAPDADGDIGIVDVTTLREELREAVKGLNAQDVSGVIETPGAFVILKVTEKDPEKIRPLEEIKNEVVRDIQAEAVATGINDLILRYKKANHIVIKAAEFIPLYDEKNTNIGG